MLNPSQPSQSMRSEDIFIHSALFRDDYPIQDLNMSNITVGQSFEELNNLADEMSFMDYNLLNLEIQNTREKLRRYPPKSRVLVIGLNPNKRAIDCKLFTNLDATLKEFPYFVEKEEKKKEISEKLGIKKIESQDISALSSYLEDDNNITKKSKRKSMRAEKKKEENLPYWIDIQSPSKEDMQTLVQYFGIHDLTVEDCLDNDSGEKWEVFKNYLFCCIHSVDSMILQKQPKSSQKKKKIPVPVPFIKKSKKTSLKKEDLNEKPKELNILVFKKFVLTIHNQPIDELDMILNRLETEFDSQYGVPVSSKYDPLREKKKANFLEEEKFRRTSFHKPRPSWAYDLADEVKNTKKGKKKGKGKKKNIKGNNLNFTSINNIQSSRGRNNNLNNNRKLDISKRGISQRSTDEWMDNFGVFEMIGGYYDDDDDDDDDDKILSSEEEELEKKFKTDKNDSEEMKKFKKKKRKEIRKRRKKRERERKRKRKEKRLKKSKKNKDFIFKSPSWILYAFIDGMADLFIPLSESLLSQAEDLYDTVMDFDVENKDLDLLRIMGVIRYRISVLKKQIDKKQEIVEILSSKMKNIFIKKSTTVYLRDVIDHLKESSDRLEDAKESLNQSHNNFMIKFQLQIANSSQQTDSFMGKITILGTILTPLSVISGSWGMNMPVPGDQQFLKPEEANLYWFFGILSVMLFIVAICLVLFFPWLFPLKKVLKVVENTLNFFSCGGYKKWKMKTTRKRKKKKKNAERTFITPIPPKLSFKLSHEDIQDIIRKEAEEDINIDSEINIEEYTKDIHL